MFKDILHDQLGAWPLGYIPYGGADVGEVAHIADQVGEGGDDAFYGAWTAAADRPVQEAEAALLRKHEAGARECLLRAAGFYAKAWHPLFGAPVDGRVLEAVRRQRQAFERGLQLGPEPVRQLQIPFDPVPLPAWLIPAQGRAGSRRPLIVLVNGYDGTITDPYFASAVAASRRGWHSLVFDGPGQGSLLAEHGVRLRPDWETVVAAVLDVALALPEVDAGRVVLSGWSLGGHLALRAAKAEPRLAACIADPGLASVADGFRAAAVRLGAMPAQARDLGALPQDILDRMEDLFQRDRRRRWSVTRRAYWVHGVDNLRAYLADVERYTLAGRTGRIRCPVLLTRAEDDGLADGAERLFELLDCPKTLLRFSRADGAGGHCEMGNRSLLNRRVFDWLDEVVG
jgi:pimeloyl-ACP methyl ester carboxylesterase